MSTQEGPLKSLEHIRDFLSLAEQGDALSASDSKEALDATGRIIEFVRAILGERRPEIGLDRASADVGTIEAALRILRDSTDAKRADEARAGLDFLAVLRSLAQNLGGGTPPAVPPHVQEIRRTPQQGRRFDVTPTFIIGYRRSGTTLLAWLLDSHPAIASVPENHLCAGLLGSTQLPLHMDGQMLGVRPNVVLAQKSLEPLGEARSIFHRRIADLIASVFSDYAARKGKRRWVAKELLIADSLDLLDLVFDYSARYIFLVRHGLDAAFSASERYGTRLGSPKRQGGLDLTTFLREWVQTNDVTYDFVERNEERCLTLRYEDFVIDSEAHARSVFSFLGEPWHDGIFADMRGQAHHPGLGDNKILETGGRIAADRRDRWVDWPASLRRQLGRLANPTLERLGYTPV